MKNKFILSVLVILSNSCCVQKDSGAVDISLLYKCWTDSREELPEGASFNIYRPCDYKNFPASRFRGRISFEENGKCSWLQFSPVDAHSMVDGEWSYDKGKKNIIIKDKSGQIAYKFKVIAITKDLMKVEREI